MEAHGGTVEATSPGEGEGATFTVRLLIHAVRVPPESNEEAIADYDGEDESASSGDVADCRPPVRFDGVHVLVVDDQPDARRVLATVLEGVGAVVTTTNSARAAMKALLTERPDVLVSDLGMPDQDGFDFLRQVREDGLTAFVQKDDAHLALLAGFQVHLPTPVDPHELTSVIARLAVRQREEP